MSLEGQDYRYDIEELEATIARLEEDIALRDKTIAEMTKAILKGTLDEYP